MRIYIYDDPNFTHLLTGIIDENNKRYATFGYDDNGRSVLSTHAGDANKFTFVYNSDGTTIITDPKLQERKYSYENQNEVQEFSAITTGPSCTSCGSSNNSTTYDLTNGFPNLVTDFNGVITDYDYNAKGLVDKITEAVGTTEERITSMTWHADYRVPTCVVKVKNTTYLEYFTNGQLEKQTVFDTSDTTLFADEASKQCDAIIVRGDLATLNKRSTSYTYYPNGLLETVDGPREDIEDITTYNYDPNGTGVLAELINPLGHSVKYRDHDGHGRPKTIEDANGLITTITYDLRGNPDLVTVGGEPTDYNYDGVGNLDLVTLPDGSFVDYEYDDAQRLTDVRDQLGNHIHYTLDALGNREVTDVKDPSETLKRTNTKIYNLKNQLQQTIGAATQKTTDYLEYDNNSNLKHVRDPGGNNTRYDYDNLNRLSTTTNELTATVVTNYDAHDNITSVKDQRDLTTIYTVDGLGNRTETNSPDTGVTNYLSHDAQGNVLTVIDARSKTTTFTYDALNRIDLITYNDGSITDYTYDSCLNGVGRLCSVSYNGATFAGDITTSWTYDLHGRIKSREQLNDGVTLTSFYNYDANGNLETNTTPGGHTLVYTYTNGQITTVKVDNRIVMDNISYDPFGPPNAWTWGNGATVSRVYDQDGQLDTYSMGNATYDNNYYPTGNVKDVNDLNNASNNQNFDYDELHRLINAQGTNLPGGIEAFDYDATGNRNLHTVGTTNYNYAISPTSNQLDNVPGPMAKTYGYDLAGNITSDSSRTYEYDDRGRFIGLDNNAINYAIDASGYRVRKLGSLPLQQGDANGDGYVDNGDIDAILDVIYGLSSAGVLHDCNTDSNINIQDIICLNNIIQAGTTPLPLSARLRFAYNDSGQLLGDYDVLGNAIQEVIWFGGQPVAILQGADIYYVYADHLGTPRAISNQTNNVVWQWQSDAFGTTRPNEDVDNDGVTFKTNLRFAGQYFDAESNLHYNVNRTYDPSTGRYLESDPIGLEGGLNTYGYVGGNPLGTNDPLGLECDDSRYAMYCKAGMTWMIPPDTRSQKEVDQGQEDLVTLMSSGIGGAAGLTKAAIVGSCKVGIRKFAKKIDNSVIGKPRIGSANKIDPTHRFNDIIDNYAGDAKKFNIPTKGPGGQVVRTSELRQIQGGLNDKDGIFEWIIDQGNVTHRRFIPGGNVTGFPNQVVK